MKAKISIGMIDVAVKLHNRVREERSELASSSFVKDAAGNITTRKAKMKPTDPENGQLCEVEKGYTIDDKFVSMNTVKERLKAQFSDVKGDIRGLRFFNPDALLVVPDGTAYAVEMTEEKREKKKVLAYIYRRLTNGEVCLAKFTYAHGFGLSQRLVMFRVENGKLNAYGVYFLGDAKENPLDYAQVKALEVSGAEQLLLDKFVERQTANFDNEIVKEIKKALSEQPDEKMGTGIPLVAEKAEPSLLELLGEVAEAEADQGEVGATPKEEVPAEA